MKLVDMFCGVGGFSAGAREFAKPVLGVDNDDVMVRLWAANTKGKGQLAELWRDHVWNCRVKTRNKRGHAHSY